MASIEYIKNRIEGKKNEITKLTKKIERMEKAKATNWEVNPYCYDERDLMWANKDLTAAKNALADWESKLATEIEKDNSRNVVAIIEFLNQWAERVMNHYINSFPAYVEATKAYEAKREELFQIRFHSNATTEQRKEARKEADKIWEEYAKAWGWIFDYVGYNGIDTEKLAKDLEQDKKAKYDDIINRTNAVVGTITDATNLRVGEKGELNGFIIGERGTAKVETIGAGGYNIQCFHFRTLIHKVR